jgi:hypothetical protein
MAAKHPMAVGVFHERQAAQRCYDLLLNRGYFDSDINLLMSEQTRALYEVPLGDTSVPHHVDNSTHHATETKAAEGMGIGGAVGTIVGGSIAAVMAVGTSLLIPGLNLIVAGPLAAAFAGGGAGAVAGGLLGGLVGLGITDDTADAYHKALREGSTILGVQLRDHDDRGQVKQLLKDCGAENIQVVND